MVSAGKTGGILESLISPESSIIPAVPGFVSDTLVIPVNFLFHLRSTIPNHNWPPILECQIYLYDYSGFEKLSGVMRLPLQPNFHIQPWEKPRTPLLLPWAADKPPTAAWVDSWQDSQGCSARPYFFLVGSFTFPCQLFHPSMSVRACPPFDLTFHYIEENLQYITPIN